LGKMVEMFVAEKLYLEPLHQFTKALLSAVPVPVAEFDIDETVLERDMLSSVNPTSGCAFHTRCPFKVDDCTKEITEYREVKDGHYVACHLYNEISNNDITNQKEEAFT